MKVLKRLVLLTIILTGCGKNLQNGEEVVPRCGGAHISNVASKEYSINVSFAGVDGNDLISKNKQSQRDYSSIISLSIILPDGSIKNNASFTILNKDGRSYLFNTYRESAWESVALQKSLTYRITCSSIFGDNTTHTIETVWEESPDDLDYPQCKSAYFDGKEVVVKREVIYHSPYRDYYSFFINIVVNNS